MLIGRRLRELREQKGLTQGDIEKATGLLRVYVSRVEHGHTIPSLETLERFASAFDIPLYQIFYTGELPATRLRPSASLEELAEEVGPSGTEARFLLKLRGLIGNISESERNFLLQLARRLAGGEY